MNDSERLHEVDSFDEAVRVGAEELGMDEDELREQIERMEFHDTPASGEAPSTVERQDD
jgi:hypothetical protein